MLRKKISLWIIASAAVLGLFILCIALFRSLSQELDAKFNAAADSVPTRVFSRVWQLKTGEGIGASEIKARLAEREYSQVDAPEKVTAPGIFSIFVRDDNKNKFYLRVWSKEFKYPVAFTSFFETNFGESNFNPGKVDLTIEGNEITKINTFDPNGELIDTNTVTLEPVMVAQISGDQIETRQAVPLSDIPHTLLEAIVTVEDQRFLEHSGIDPRGIARSIWANLRAGSYVQGASTITQQLIRNVYLSRTKTISRKLKEMILAVMLEMKYSKDTILEKYLNEVYFGQSGNFSIHGVSQAAKHYFNKKMSELTIAEQALLAAIVRGPFYYSPFRYFDRVKQRQEFVLKRMLETNIISQKEHDWAVKEKLRFAQVLPIQDRAPYFTDMVKSQLIRDVPEQAVLNVGYQIFSTVDTYYQKLAEQAVSQQLLKLEDNMRAGLAKRKREEEVKLLQGALLSVDPRTNQILAMVGGRSFAESNYNRILLMKRQVGSIIKPFVFLAALIYGKDPDGQPYNAISKLDDTPFTYEYDKQKWSPKNFEEENLGAVTFRYALANSINIPTAKLAINVGLPYLVDVAKKAGVTSELSPLPSLSLGTAELSPLEVADAYNTIANLGLKREMTSVLVIVDGNGDPVAHFETQSEQVLPLPETANLVDLLQSIFSIGTAKSARELGFTFPAAGKTGTTNEYRDAWFAGFTPKLLTVSWVGYDKDDKNVAKLRKTFKLTGAVAALPVWTQYMKTALAETPPYTFKYPDGTLKHVRVDLLTGGLADHACGSGNNIIEETFTYNNSPKFSCNLGH